MNLRSIVYQLLILCLPIFGQAQMAFNAQANAKQVVLGGQFEVTYSVVNPGGQVTNFKPPDFQNFKVLRQPMQSSSSSTINGVSRSTIEITYFLQSEKLGIFTIGSATVLVGGKAFRSSPITMEVVRARDLRQDVAGEAEPIFFRAEPNIEKIYVGQQVLVDFKLYMRPNYIKERYRETSLPDYPGFYGEILNWYRVFQEVIDGVPYTSWTIRRLALFPQKDGSLTVGPMNLMLEVSNRNDPPRGFFMRPTKRMNLTSNPINIEVMPLPGGAPASFTGAIGEYQFSATVNRNTITADDALALKLHISGTGDIKRVGNPRLRVSDSLEVFEPNILKEETEELQGQLFVEKNIEYLITPKMTGRYEIPLEFSYFHPDSVKYVTIRLAPVQLNVLPGKDREERLTDAPVEQEVPGELSPVKTETRLKKRGEYFIGSPVFWTFFSLPILGFAGLLVWRQRQVQIAALDPALVRSRKARTLARQHLAAAHQHLEAGEGRKFHDELSRASLGYICDKLHIERAKLSKEKVRETLLKQAIEPDLIERFMRIIRTCEMALFAGVDNAADRQQTYEQAVEVFSRLEEAIGQK